MEKFISVVYCVVISSTVASPPSVTKQYRSDYEYNRKTDAFYKLHVETVGQWEMSTACQVEGGTPLVLSSKQDLVQVHAMMKRYPDLGEYVWVADDGEVHESAEQQPIIDLSNSNERDNHMCEVITRDGKVQTTFCYQNLPFVCKVEAKDAPYDKQCGVFGLGYQYFSSVGSCYKIPRVAYTWNQAYTECQSEGAHLVVINSETEREVVQNLTKAERSVTGSTTSYFFLAGFRAEKTTGAAPRVFKTIFNQTLEEAGFAEWSEHEPNNAGGKEYCGTIFKSDGKFNDVDCTHDYAFICEKEIRPIR